MLPVLLVSVALGMKYLVLCGLTCLRPRKPCSRVSIFAPRDGWIGSIMSVLFSTAIKILFICRPRLTFSFFQATQCAFHPPSSPFCSNLIFGNSFRVQLCESNHTSLYIFWLYKLYHDTRIPLHTVQIMAVFCSPCLSKLSFKINLLIKLICCIGTYTLLLTSYSVLHCLQQVL